MGLDEKAGRAAMDQLRDVYSDMLYASRNNASSAPQMPSLEGTAGASVGAPQMPEFQGPSRGAPKFRTDENFSLPFFGSIRGDTPVLGGLARAWQNAWDKPTTPDYLTSGIRDLPVVGGVSRAAETALNVLQEQQAGYNEPMGGLLGESFGQPRFLETIRDIAQGNYSPQKLAQLATQAPIAPVQIATETPRLLGYGKQMMERAEERKAEGQEPLSAAVGAWQELGHEEFQKLNAVQQFAFSMAVDPLNWIPGAGIGKKQVAKAVSETKALTGGLRTAEELAPKVFKPGKAPWSYDKLSEAKEVLRDASENIIATLAENKVDDGANLLARMERARAGGKEFEALTKAFPGTAARGGQVAVRLFEGGGKIGQAVLGDYQKARGILAGQAAETKVGKAMTEALAKIRKAGVQGDDALRMLDDAARVDMAERTGRLMAENSTKVFGAMPKANAVQRMFNGLRSLEALIYIGLSPVTLARNFINNKITLLVEGVNPFLSTERRLAWVASKNPQKAAALKQVKTMSESLFKARDAINRALGEYGMSTGLTGTTSGFVNKFPSLLNVYQNVEKYDRALAWENGVLKALHNNWVAGKWIPGIDSGLAAKLDLIDPQLRRQIMSAVEMTGLDKAARQKFVQAALDGKVPHFDLDGFARTMSATLSKEQGREIQITATQLRAMLGPDGQAAMRSVAEGIAKSMSRGIPYEQAVNDELVKVARAYEERIIRKGFKAPPGAATSAPTTSPKPPKSPERLTQEIGALMQKYDKAKGKSKAELYERINGLMDEYEKVAPTNVSANEANALQALEKDGTIRVTLQDGTVLEKKGLVNDLGREAGGSAPTGDIATGVPRAAGLERAASGYDDELRALGYDPDLLTDTQKEFTVKYSRARREDLGTFAPGDVYESGARAAGIAPQEVIPEPKLRPTYTQADVARFAYERGMPTGTVNGRRGEARLLDFLNQYKPEDAPLFKDYAELRSRADDAMQVLTEHEGEIADYKRYVSKKQLPTMQTDLPAPEMPTEAMTAERAAEIEQRFGKLFPGEATGPTTLRELETRLFDMKQAGASAEEIAQVRAQYQELSKSRGMSGAAPLMSGEVLEPPRTPFGENTAEDAIRRLRLAAEASPNAADPNDVAEIAKGEAELMARVFEAMRTELVKVPPKADIGNQARKGVMRWLKEVDAAGDDAARAAMKHGDWLEGATVLNYDGRWNVDNALSFWMPFSFWRTHYAAETLRRVVDRPQLAAFYLHLSRQLEELHNSPEYPQRFKGLTSFPMPFLPEWMGGQAFFDPLETMMPVKQVFSFRDYGKVDDNDVAQNIRVMVQKGAITQADAEYALVNKDKAQLWKEVQQELTNKSQGVGDLGDIMAPHLPLQIAMKMMQGNPEDIGVMFPFTRYARAAESMGVPGAGLVAQIEPTLRKAIGLPEYEAWHQYRIDRMLANMVGDDPQLAREALIAMMERKGPLYEEAQKRAEQESAVGTLMPLTATKVFPTGERAYYAARVMRDSILDQEIQKAGGDPATMNSTQKWEFASANGLTAKGTRLNKFLDEHPEMDVKKQVFEQQEGRLKDFLISEIWDKYNTLTTLDRRVLSEQLGKNFQANFRNKDTRNYDAMTLDELATWTQAVRGYVPQAQGVPLQQGAVTPFEQRPVGESLAYAEYLKTQQQFGAKVGGVDKLMALGDQYHTYPEGSAERRAFAAKYPVVIEYWNWKRQFMTQHPDLARTLDYNITSSNYRSSYSPQVATANALFSMVRRAGGGGGGGGRSGGGSYVRRSSFAPAQPGELSWGAVPTDVQAALEAYWRGTGGLSREVVAQLMKLYRLYAAKLGVHDLSAFIAKLQAMRQPAVAA